MEVPRFLRGNNAVVEADSFRSPEAETADIVALFTTPIVDGVNQFVLTDAGVVPVTRHDLAQNEAAAAAIDKPLPTRQEITETLVEHGYHPPALILGENRRKGAGTILLNRGNPNDASFDRDTPTVSNRVHQALVLFEGSAPATRLAAISETSVEDVLFHTGVEGMYTHTPTETDIIVSSPPLQEHLGDLTEQGINYQELVLAPDVQTIQERNREREEALKEYEARTLTRIREELQTYFAAD